jgi:hypothetical protein
MSEQLAETNGMLAGGASEYRAEIDRLRVEIGNATEELEAVDRELGELAAERGAVRDRERVVTDPGEASPAISPAMITSPCYERTIRETMNKILCPMCREQPRALIITVCGHSFCQRCVDLFPFTNVCPRCEKLFTPAQLKPFFYTARFTNIFPSGETAPDS